MALRSRRKGLQTGTETAVGLVIFGLGGVGRWKVFEA
jgi:hypothetical protein